MLDQYLSRKSLPASQSLDQGYVANSGENYSGVTTVVSRQLPDETDISPRSIDVPGDVTEEGFRRLYIPTKIRAGLVTAPVSAPASRAGAGN